MQILLKHGENAIQENVVFIKGLKMNYILFLFAFYAGAKEQTNRVKMNRWAGAAAYKNITNYFENSRSCQIFNKYLRHFLCLNII